MKRGVLCLLALCLVLSGCGSPSQPQNKHYTATFLNLFDTVTTIIGPGESEAAFQAQAQQLHNRLETYHKLFDIYHDYEGLNNLKTVNEQAGIAPVAVDGEIIKLLTDCKEYHRLSDGKVNVAMGSVLSLWHIARSDGIRDPLHARLPDSNALEEAAEHISIHSIVIDEEASTVFITDPEVRLDVGAVAKGWACQRVAETAPTGFLLSVGGNVCATGPKTVQGDPWVIGIQDPDNSSANLHTIRITGGSVVTSGDYQRSYRVEGKSYHHIIDPTTLNPGTLWRSVSVVCPDSALADALSTSLFLLPLEEGKALAARYRVQVLWLNHQGQEYMTEDFQALIRT
jgi:thiamine biosynthesis lipoprotein